MKQTIAVFAAMSLLCAGLATAQSTAPAPVAGKTTLGVAMVEMEAVIGGWSVQKDILKKAVVNEQKEKIGTISDIVISPNPDAKLTHASFAIIAVGGFLGMGKHDVAIPIEQLKLQDHTLVLPGATKDALKALPKFEYRKR
jgi:sporulation protein YlmC with PRC-barrel domain